MGSAFKFNNKKLVKADYDVLMNNEGEFFAGNSLLFENDKFISRKKIILHALPPKNRQNISLNLFFLI